MSISMDAANALERVIDGKIAKAAPKRTRTAGTVTRIDQDGTPYVMLDGSNAETPATSTAAAVKPNQRVGVTVGGGQLTIDGNYSAPATDDTTALDARAIADDAKAKAVKAGKVADSAKRAADEAGEVAEATEQHFWSDANGVHVTEAEGDATTEHNILMNSLGILLRKALNNLVSITASAISFFDGSGNTAQHVTASFGGSGANLYASGVLRQKTAADGSHYYAPDGTTELLNIKSGAPSSSPTSYYAVLDFFGSNEINATGDGIVVSTGDRLTNISKGSAWNSFTVLENSGFAYLIARKLSNNSEIGLAVEGPSGRTAVKGALDFNSMANAGSSTDFFATGIQAFANGGRLRYKGLADMRSWLGLDNLAKVVSATSNSISIAANSNHSFAPTLTIPSGYTLVGSLGCKYTANNANLSTAACYKYSATQIAAVVVNHGSSARNVAVTTYGLCVKTAFVG